MREQQGRLGPEAVERTIEYQDLCGNDQSDVLRQMLQHVVNHGTYHRGHIATMLRQLDAAPPKSMDLIAFYRERSGRLDLVNTGQNGPTIISLMKGSPAPGREPATWAESSK